MTQQFQFTQKAVSQIFTPMFLAAIIHNNQQLEVTQVSVNGWMDKPNAVYTLIDKRNLSSIYHSVISFLWGRTSCPMPHRGWTLKTNAKWSKRWHKYCMIPVGTYSTETESLCRQKVQSGYWVGEVNRKLSFNKYRIAVVQDEKSSGDGWCCGLYNNMNVPNITELYT